MAAFIDTHTHKKEAISIALLLSSSSPLEVPQVSLRDPVSIARSALRGLYITVNESCQFYYQRIKAPL